MKKQWQRCIRNIDKTVAEIYVMYIYIIFISIIIYIYIYIYIDLVHEKHRKTVAGVH